MNRLVHVLLVEDNPADVDLARESFGLGALAVRLSVAVDGVEAIEFLAGRGKYASVARPDLVLLDLNLPRIDGRGVLAVIKGSPELSTLPVVVLSSSNSDRDVVESYRLGANCYVTKPVGFKDFQKMVEAVEDFWCNVVQLPRSRGRSEGEEDGAERTT